MRVAGLLGSTQVMTEHQSGKFRQEPQDPFAQLCPREVRKPGASLVNQRSISCRPAGSRSRALAVEVSGLSGPKSEGRSGFFTTTHGNRTEAVGNRW